MADRIAILGGEPYAEWIKRDGPAQRMYKAYSAKWPDGNTACFVAGDDFYVRLNDGRMRYVKRGKHNVCNRYRGPRLHARTRRHPSHE